MWVINTHRPCCGFSRGSEWQWGSPAWVTCSGSDCSWTTLTKCWDIQKWPSYNLPFAHQRESYDLVISAYAHPVPVVSNWECCADYHPHQKLQQCFLAECYLLQEPRFTNPTCLDAVSHNLTLDSWASAEHYFNNISDAQLLAACSASSKYNKDNPSFDTVTCGPFQAQFWKAMYNKLTTLIQEFNSWDYVSHTPDMNVLPSIWAFKIKLFPNGQRLCEEIQNTLLCMRGQTERGNWLFWNLGSCCPMVDSASWYDSGNKNEVNLRPMQYNSCIHPWTGHWNHLWPST